MYVNIYDKAPVLFKVLGMTNVRSVRSIFFSDSIDSSIYCFKKKKKNSTFDVNSRFIYLLATFKEKANNLNVYNLNNFF